MAEQIPSIPPPSSGAGPSDTTNLFNQLSAFVENTMNKNKVEMEALINQKFNEKDTSEIEKKKEKEGDKDKTENPPKSDKVSFLSFKKCGATEFEGTVDPIKAFNWIKNVEKVFRICDCQEAEKGKYSTAMLIGPALHWWEDMYDSMTEARRKELTWGEFKEKFNIKYCPEDRQEKYALEFLALKQDKKSVSEYLAEFLSKSRFAPEYVSSESKKIKKFVSGLKMEIREFVSGHKFDSLKEAAEHASRREDIIEIKDAESMPPPKRLNTSQSAPSFPSLQPGPNRSFSQSSRPSSVKL